MSVSEYQRHQIFQWFEEHMGSERAASMMNLLPPIGWGDIATGADLRNLEISLRGGIDRLDGKTDKVEGRLVHEMAKLRLHIHVTMIGGNIAVASMVLAAVRLG